MSKTQKDNGSDLQTKDSELTEAETNAVADLKERKRSSVRAPDIKLDFDEDTRRLKVGHMGKDPKVACALAMHELGTIDYRFFEGVMDQVAILGQHDSSVSETASNFVMSVVAGVRPQDEIEAMLAIQMGAIHQAAMMMARRLNHVKTLPQQDSAERALNKLSRTFTSQVETLKRYRSKADQTVRVERVEVREGGQAIVGNVQNGGGRMTKSDDNLTNPTKRLNDAPRCTATAKSTGKRCRAPAVQGWSVCRVHGARGGHAAGPSHPSWKHGERSRKAEEMRKIINDLIRADKELEKLIK